MAGNGLQNGFLKTVQDKLFSRVAWKSLKCCKNVVSRRNAPFKYREKLNVLKFKRLNK